ncbi:CopG family transcriptional regulator [Luteolibacter ambystomatis]|uniref:CopG family transcriptional regulator n=1 Tax=Luteolibacter ambystomatis TaxID=2824561 RepID=A0A975G8P7_9BACT|nr:ribbon-helix-helix protein, CopG family [Luteolibacter ambystomatis]QUE51409.1 CopG family transcriptional regulator [Luteolibacter ambystomatis]
MRTITLKIPDELDDRLEALARERHDSKSAVVRAAVIDLLSRETPGAATAWVDHFRGALSEPEAMGDDRMEHIIAKHVR